MFKELIMRDVRRSLILFTAVVLTGTAARAGWVGEKAGWKSVKNGKRAGCSGLARIDGSKGNSLFLMVHDNKKPDQPKVAMLTLRKTGRPGYKKLRWPKRASQPVDLEALTAVPGGENEFLACTSKGTVFHLRLEGGTRLRVLKDFSLPGCSGKNIEGLGLYEQDGILVAVWGHRGGNGNAGELFCAALDLAGYKFADTDTKPFLAPWPTGNNVRSISDLAVRADGSVYVSTASDPGDDGPFDSCVYAVGTVSISEGNCKLRLADKPVEIGRLPGHKVEGMALVPGKGAELFLGTDDENKGSSLFRHRL